MESDREELQSWAMKWRVDDLLPTLISNGFTFLDSILTITPNDLLEMGITKIGDRRRLELAISRSITPATPTLPLSQSPAPRSPLPLPPHSPLGTPTPASHLEPPPSPAPSITIPSTQTQKRCKCNCHQYLGQGHNCTPEQKCPGYHACLHLNFHPEEKKQQRAAASAEKKWKRVEEKEEENKWKKRKDDLLHLHKQPEFEGWWQPRLAEIVASDLEKYSLEEGTRARAMVMIVVAQEHTWCRHDIKVQGAINKKITSKLKAMPQHLSIEEEVAYIKKRQGELQEEGNAITEEEREESNSEEEEELSNGAVDALIDHYGGDGVDEEDEDD